MSGNTKVKSIPPLKTTNCLRQVSASDIIGVIDLRLGRRDLILKSCPFEPRYKHTTEAVSVQPLPGSTTGSAAQPQQLHRGIQN